MSLIHLTLLQRDSAERTVGGKVLNSSFITEMTVSGTGASFLYCGNPESRRGGHERIVVSDTVARIRAIMNQDPAQASITLAVFPRQDPTEDPTWTVFNISEVVECFPYSRASRKTGLVAGTYSWLDINEKGQLKRYLIDHYYMELPMLFRTVSTSSTTSHN